MAGKTPSGSARFDWDTVHSLAHASADGGPDRVSTGSFVHLPVRLSGPAWVPVFSLLRAPRQASATPESRGPALPRMPRRVPRPARLQVMALVLWIGQRPMLPVRQPGE